jgi:hypothetical protein
MLSPIIRRTRKSAEPRPQERGFTMALVAVALVTIIVMAALSIDLGTLYQAKAEAQRAADAAALTAARVVSLSGITGAAVASDLTAWPQICGGATSLATLAAIDVAQAQQNFVSGVAIPTPNISVGYSSGNTAGTNADCSSVGVNFNVNPTVTVTVTSAKLPIFFARVFSIVPGAKTFANITTSATASAEVFNPSSSSPMIPVNPRCVKPWIVPNQDPGSTPLKGFVDPATGSILSQGVSPNGVIGETFSLDVDCGRSRGRGGRCVLNEQPQANPGANPTLDYVPGQVLSAPIAIAANSKIGACADVNNNDYTEAVAGCDQATVYACGVAGGNTVELTEDPGPPRNDSVNGAQCLINATDATPNSPPTNGQDYLAPGAAPYTYPFQILAGGNSALLAANPLAATSGSQITSSPSIVSVPIYDNTAPKTLNGFGTTAVTIVGFLQVFINSVDGVSGNINVTVMNVAGCSNAATNPPVYGTSPVPIRLITQP